MIRYYKIRLRRNWKVLLVAVFVILMIYQLLSSNDVLRLCPSSNHGRAPENKYIFDLAHWRQLQANRLKGDTHLCDVPRELASIAKAICAMYNIGNCKRLPCYMVYASSHTLEDVKCLRGGLMLKTGIDGSTGHQSMIRCRRGFALDLFVKKYDKSSYPSIIADPFVPFSKDLYVDVLNNRYRTCDSMWGFNFNFESISNYPWAADAQNLKLFDLTFGYDRSIYDFVPAPWLFNYVEQLTSSSKRLSIEKVMLNKKPIHSGTTSNLYWTNEPISSALPDRNSNASYIRAPIMWMNSNCYTKSKRTEYMHQLMQYIDVDNYGNCGDHIRKLPQHIVEVQHSLNRDLKDRGSYNWEVGKLTLSGEYLFTIAIENSLNYDYITEKLWHPLMAGSVPIYLGASNIYEWLPCEGTNCIIDLRKFKTPEDAARHIKMVATNRTAYQNYHRWRNEPLSKSFQSKLNYFRKMGHYSLECILCDWSHRMGQGEDLTELKKKLKVEIGQL